MIQTATASDALSVVYCQPSIFVLVPTRKNEEMIEFLAEPWLLPVRVRLQPLPFRTLVLFPPQLVLPMTFRQIMFPRVLWLETTTLVLANALTSATPPSAGAAAAEAPHVLFLTAFLPQLPVVAGSASVKQVLLRPQYQSQKAYSIS